MLTAGALAPFGRTASVARNTRPQVPPAAGAASDDPGAFFDTATDVGLDTLHCRSLTIGPIAVAAVRAGAWLFR